MGGDAAPNVVIQGAADYLKDHMDTDIVLVGKEKEIRKEIKKDGIDFSRQIEIVNAREAISMREHFFSYWKKRKRSSIMKAIDLVKQKKAQAMVSAGNTGAVMAIAKNVLGTLKRIERPALALTIPTLKGSSLLMDVGANVDSKPRNLVQHALMGKVYLEHVMGVSNPRIALMSIGEEEAKGNELIKVTHNLLKSMNINFIGNVEGRDVYAGEADLIVTDGFTGNVTLKVAEGVVDMMRSMLNKEINKSILSQIGFFFLNRSLKRIWKRMDYSEYGGALLLGVNGIVIIGHGGSSRKAIKNAINLSKKFISENVLDKISNEIDNMQEVFKELRYV